LLVFSVLLGAVHWYWGPVIAWWAVAIAFVVGLILLGLSLFLAYRKRTRCAQNLKIGIETLTSLGARPHIIAHSFGTYLIGRFLKRYYASVDLGNVVLVSTVLPRRYPWRAILAKKPHCITGVRSEYGEADRVVKLVRWIRWLAWDLGTAGAHG